MRPFHLERSLVIWGAVVLLLFVATALAYLPGLSGGFLFDDAVNLEKLGAYGPVDNLRTLLFYLTSGTADPTGRPVSLLTFLLDARNWPADPFPFKRTNLVVHLLNGALLLALLDRLEARLAPQASEDRRRWVALLGAALWLVHPLFVSTTLYVVQREAMLPLSFALVALLAWDRGLSNMLAHARKRDVVLAVAAVWAATVLGTLSKANGALTPLLGCAVYLCVQRPSLAQTNSPLRRRADVTAIVALGLPALAAIGMLLMRWRPLDFQPAHRDWTIGERLLTQPRALIDYLHLLFAPRSGSGGVFVEGFEPSRSLLEPWTTTPALLAVMLLLLVAIALRNRAPAMACAILFFFIAHLAESTFIPLELYFEHRNYLPAALLFWPVARWLIHGTHVPAARTFLALLLPILMLAMTWQRATVWGDPILQARYWGVRNEDSMRSQATHARALAQSGDIASGIEVLKAAQAKQPHSMDLALNRISLECHRETVSVEAVARAEEAFRELEAWNFPYYRWLQDFAHAGEGKHLCPGISQEHVDRLIAAARANPATARTPRRRQNWYYVEGSRALAKADPEAALSWFDRSLALGPDPDRALVQAATLGNHGRPDLGVRHLDYFVSIKGSTAPTHVRDMASVHKWLLANVGHFDNEVTILRAKLQQAADEVDIDEVRKQSPVAEKQSLSGEMAP